MPFVRCRFAFWMIAFVLLPLSSPIARAQVPMVAELGFAADGAITLMGQGISLGTGRQGTGSVVMHGESGRAVLSAPPPLVNRLGHAVTVTAWINAAALPPSGKTMTIVSKRQNQSQGTPFVLQFNHQGKLVMQGFDGVGWNGNFTAAESCITPGQWQHVALTWSANGQGVLYCDGKEVGKKLAARVTTEQPAADIRIRSVERHALPR